MGEVKFRAWSNEEGEYTYSDMYRAEWDYSDLELFFKSADISVLEQWSNTCDINKKEIYAGDKIKWENGPMSGEGVVVKDGGCFRLKGYVLDENLLTYEFARCCCEVVGHIHEEERPSMAESQTAHNKDYAKCPYHVYDDFDGKMIHQCEHPNKDHFA